MKSRRLRESVRQVRAALIYSGIVFGAEALTCVLLPPELFGASSPALALLMVSSVACVAGAGLGLTRVERAPGEASVVLAMLLTTGTFVSAMVLGFPSGQSLLIGSFAILCYGSGAFLSVAAWFAARTLRGAPSVALGGRRLRRRAGVARTGVNAGTGSGSRAA